MITIISSKLIDDGVNLHITYEVDGEVQHLIISLVNVVRSYELWHQVQVILGKQS